MIQDKLVKKSGRKPTRLARLLRIIKDDLKIGNTWDSGAAIDEIAEKLYPEEYKENPYKAKMMTRSMIATLRRKLPKLFKEVTGVKFPTQFFPFFSSKPTIMKKGVPQTNPFEKSRYFYHMDIDDLEKVRIKLDRLQRAFENSVRDIEITQELLEKNLYPEEEKVMGTIEEEIGKSDLEPEEKKKLINRIKKKLVEEAE